MEKQNLDSIDYDVNQIRNYDHRMEAGKKNAVFFHALGIIATVLATICMFAFGSGDPVDMIYFLGMPLWISGTILIYVAMLVIGMVYLFRWKDFSLNARENAKEVEKK